MPTRAEPRGSVLRGPWVEMSPAHHHRSVACFTCVAQVESDVRDPLLLRTPAGGAQSECSLDLKKQLLHKFFREAKGRPTHPPQSIQFSSLVEAGVPSTPCPHISWYKLHLSGKVTLTANFPTFIKFNRGECGHRSRYLSHAKRALYHLS